MMNVLQIIDSLHAGGAERVAVNYANGLLNYINHSHLCATRDEGLLVNELDADVEYLFLRKKSRIDLKAIFKLRAYVIKHKISIIHAHSSSFFIATIVKLSYPKVKIVWHDHYGNSDFLDQRPKAILKLCSSLFSQIFAVNSKLKDWAVTNLKCKNVDYVRNFPVLKKESEALTKLKGIKGKRILCLANLREQKNQLLLLSAFNKIKSTHPDWTLHCIGKDFKDNYSKTFFNKLDNLNLNEHVYFYSSKSDVLNIINQCEIGILVSKSEGLPLALLEYGLGKLAVICTNVGECSSVISDNNLGILIDSEDELAIVNAIKQFITDKIYRENCAELLHKNVNSHYSLDKVMEETLDVYLSVLGRDINK